VRRQLTWIIRLPRSRRLTWSRRLPRSKLRWSWRWRLRRRTTVRRRRVQDRGEASSRATTG
jgi:hypothetical protein